MQTTEKQFHKVSITREQFSKTLDAAAPAALAALDQRDDEYLQRLRNKAQERLNLTIAGAHTKGSIPVVGVQYIKAEQQEWARKRYREALRAVIARCNDLLEARDSALAPSAGLFAEQRELATT